ncbi:MAG: hypothetical protein DMG50_15065 [Acidobacteria bacterium]|nr:MAG: hypothetical protein DMG50_15065 [Acidobacteriota bacterium]
MTLVLRGAERLYSIRLVSGENMATGAIRHGSSRPDNLFFPGVVRSRDHWVVNRTLGAMRNLFWLRTLAFRDTGWPMRTTT